MRGVDVHQDKGNPDWGRAFAAGTRFAWLKVSEGGGGHPNEKILPWYRRNRPAAKAAGIRVGGYHFLTTGIASSTPQEEAEFFVSRLDLEPGDLLPVCDFEQEPPDLTQVLTFLRIVAKKIGVKPILYLNSDFLERGLSSGTQAEAKALKQFPIWFADYGPNDGKDHGIGHDTHGLTVLAHQFTSRGKTDGVAAPTDLNELKAPSLDAISFQPGAVAELAAAPISAPGTAMPKLNPDGSPSKALDDLRKRKIREREDGGQITPHFHMNEFHTKDARGSAVPIESWPALIRLCEDYLEPMRAKFGKCTVISGYRHRAYNNTIPGAATNSQHIYDETPDSVAADTRYERGSSAQWVTHAKKLRTQLGNKGGIGRYDRDGFIHIDNRGVAADWQGN